MAMTSHSFLGLGPHGFHRVAYVEWGGPEARVLVCVHGLTRNGRDFDALARSLEDVYRVVCPDMPGRGRSDWLSDPQDYQYPVYLSDLTALIARLGSEEVDWLGTSMGGILGMMLASQPRSPLRRLVLNDVGPHIPREALERIGAYVGGDPKFADLRELESHLRQIHAPFGNLTDEQWHQLALHSSRQLPDGRLALHYDPSLVKPLGLDSPSEVDLWPVWDRIRCPVLVLRGARSDLLLPDTVREMNRRGPGAEVIEVADAGHAPALMAPEQVAAVRNWLQG